MKTRLVELGCPEQKIGIQRISVRLDQLPAREAQPAGSRTPVLLFAGRFVEKKGLIYALKAADEVRRRGYRFEFRIIGDGPLAAECRAFIAEHGLGENVRFLGLLQRPEYMKELASADIFVSPSVTAANGDTEGGAPTTILEAQALGLPILASTHADIPNITVPGLSALLAPERDSIALAAALAKLLDDPPSWSRMGEAGREFVATHHDVSREVARLEDRYLSLMGTPVQ